MKSSTGEYYRSLDHARALAAFLVFAWHFNHTRAGEYDTPLGLGWSFLTEGHTGVAIFMTLSGYLFAKLLDGRTVHLAAFLWNRMLRLLPLLIVVIALVAVEKALRGTLSWEYIGQIGRGLVQPTLPNGGWSITVEAHFYVLLPVLLALGARSRYSLLGVLSVAIALRLALYLKFGTVQDIAYWTIVGRIDQFLCGILAFQFRDIIGGHPQRAAAVALSFSLLLWGFDLGGGFYGRETYPSATPLWIVVPTVEGAAYGWLIAYYDDWYTARQRQHPGRSSSQLSVFIALIGTYSYSIYLLHPFFVFRIGRAIDTYVIELQDRPYLTLALSVPVFLLMVPIAHFSYRFIELPPMRFRRRYLGSTKMP
jgi:rhamnosyltransferase